MLTPIVRSLQAIKPTMGIQFHRTILIGQKYAPEILTVTGVAGMVGGTVLACRSTIKAQDVLAEHMESLETIKKAAELIPEEYSRADRGKDTLMVYTRIVIDLGRAYAVPAVMMTLSAAAIFGSHKMMMARNAGLAAVVKATDAAFKEYRGRVIEKHGKDEDIALRNGFTEKEMSFLTAEKEEHVDGRSKPNKRDATFSMYAKCFDESSCKWSKTPSYNQMFLETQQIYANELLNTRGHIFLNEVYDSLGLPRTKEGAIVGWVQNGNGDGYVDFGLYNPKNPTARDFINGYERSIFLDFNVDGVIYDLI